MTFLETDEEIEAQIETNRRGPATTWHSTTYELVQSEGGTIRDHADAAECRDWAEGLRRHRTRITRAIKMLEGDGSAYMGNLWEVCPAGSVPFLDEWVASLEQEEEERRAAAAAFHGTPEWEAKERERLRGLRDHFRSSVTHGRPA